MKLELEFCTLIYVQKKNDTTNKKSIFHAYLSVYGNYGSYKKVCFRIYYEFTRHKGEYILADKYVKNTNDIRINSEIKSFDALYDAIQDALSQNCLFFDCNNTPFKHFVKLYYSAPFNQYAYRRIYENKVSCFFELCNNLINYRLKKNFGDIEIKIYHMSFVTTKQAYRQPAFIYPIYVIMNLLHEINVHEFTECMFYNCKTIVIDFEFNYSGEKKQYAYVLPIKDQKLLACIWSKSDQKMNRSIENFYQKYILTFYQEHYTYLVSIFSFLVYTKRIFETAKFTTIGIHKVICDIDYINFLMIRLVKNSSYLRVYIHSQSFNIQIKDWYNSNECLNTLLKSTTYKMLLYAIKQDETYLKLREFIINLFNMCYKFICRKMKLVKFDENPCFFLIDKNQLYDHELNKLVINQLSQTNEG
ncbi:hypothetical protein COBT_001342 [Conglomerata obtusa]